MIRYVFLLLVTISICSCKETNRSQNSIIEQPSKSSKAALDILIDELTLQESFTKNDVRRYGVFPGKAIGSHPKTGVKKMDELLNLAELGLELEFTKGRYRTVLNLSNRQNINIKFNETEFTGAILINGSAQNTIHNIQLKGTLVTYSTFSTSFADKISIDSLLIKNDSTQNISGFKSSGFNVYTGTSALDIKHLDVEGTGSSGDQYRYTHAALMIHGKSPAPSDILIEKAIIHSSDRHGTYLSGRYIDIGELHIKSFAQGNIQNTIPIAYTTLGDEKKISALWLNDFEDSTIHRLYINTETSPKAFAAVFLDTGNLNFPSIILDLSIQGNNKSIRKIEGTNIEIVE